MKKFVAVAGNIGAGKTSLVQFLNHSSGFKPVYEPFIDNPYLDDFYKDMKRWAFRSQLYFLTHKFRLHLDLSDEPETIIQDRTIYEDAEIFAQQLHRSRLIVKRDFDVYWELYQSMKQVLRPPDLLIYLRCSVRSIKQRIKQRGRKSEKDIPTRYLRNLNTRYDEWIDEYSLSPVMVWDSDNMDFLTDLVDRIDFQRSLEPFLK